MTPDEVRQLIRDELSVTTPTPEQHKQASKPINQRELCTFLGLTEPTVIRWRKKGKIPFMQIGSAIRYDVNTVIEALEGGKSRRGVRR